MMRAGAQTEFFACERIGSGGEVLIHSDTEDLPMTVSPLRLSQASLLFLERSDVMSENFP